MQVSMSNHKSTESAIKNLECKAEKNTKEECKVVMTRSRLVATKEGEKGIGAEKQPLVSNPTLDPVVESLSEYEEELEVLDERKKETTIKVSEQEINKEKNKEKEEEKEKEK